jgi:hypothetical protein
VIRFLMIVALLSLAGCATPNAIVQPPPTTAGDEAQYDALFPYYAEICALSQLGKKPGFGAELSSGIGGHAVLYLHRVCRKSSETYPVLEICDGAPDSAGDGVGLSVNAHYAGASWVAVEGRKFFFDGNLEPGQPLTRQGYEALQKQAEAKKIYDDVDFHDEVYSAVPADFTPDQAKYEVSVATDYAIAFGRNRYCGRIPLGRPQMLRIIDYLNELNRPYKDRSKVFDWNLFNHNCSHINHNALASADLWQPWPMDRSLLVSLFDFPVPKNEFVNVMRRTNDLPIDDIEALYDDPAARALLMDYGRLPTEPGAIADLGSIVSPNDVYDTQSRIIFYDDPITGRYQRWFDRMMSDPRYFRIRDNLAYFDALYRKIEDGKRPVEWYLDKRNITDEREAEAFRMFYRKYYDYIADQVREMARDNAILNGKNS